jgi:hypothetical protein
MAVSADYSTPVMVNGFSCKNCTDVANAKKQIDPAHPKSGPYGINAKDDSSVKQMPDAVTFGGSLRDTRQALAGSSGAANPLNTATGSAAIGGQLDISL